MTEHPSTSAAPVAALRLIAATVSAALLMIAAISWLILDSELTGNLAMG